MSSSDSLEKQQGKIKHILEQMEGKEVQGMRTPRKKNLPRFGFLSLGIPFRFVPNT